MVTLHQRVVAGGIAAFRREPSGRRASTIGEDSSSRRPSGPTRRLTRRRSSSSSSKKRSGHELLATVRDGEDPIGSVADDLFDPWRRPSAAAGCPAAAARRTAAARPPSGSSEQRRVGRRGATLVGRDALADQRADPLLVLRAGHQQLPLAEEAADRRADLVAQRALGGPVAPAAARASGGAVASPWRTPLRGAALRAATLARDGTPAPPPLGARPARAARTTRPPWTRPASSSSARPAGRGRARAAAARPGPAGRRAGRTARPRRPRAAERPLDLGPAVVVAAVVAVDDERHPSGATAGAPQQAERGARVPEPDQVGGGDQEDLRRDGERGAVDGALGAEQLGADVDDDVR